MTTELETGVHVDSGMGSEIYPGEDTGLVAVAGKDMDSGTGTSTGVVLGTGNTTGMEMEKEENIED